MGIPRRTRVILGGDGGREFRLSRPVALLLGGVMLVTWVVAALLALGVVQQRQQAAQLRVLERQLAAARAEVLAARARQAEILETRRLQGEVLVMLGLVEPDSTGSAPADWRADLPLGTVTGAGAAAAGGITEVPATAPDATPADPGAAPSRWPAAGTIVREFSPADPARGVEGHPGLDIAGAEGSRVVAAAAGDVDFVGEDEVLGRYVEIRHGLDWVTIYGHCASISVGPGHRVRAGEQVAKMGRTGQATTAQLHFQVWRHGVAVDPRQHISGEPAPR